MQKTSETPASPNQFALLKTRRFLPVFLVQFLGAFNDQVYQKAFVALVTYRLADQMETPIALLGVIASALFILPFAIVTPTAGQIADRVDKAVMMRWVKGWEIVVMCLAVIGYHTQNIYFLYFVLFLMGAQSAVFAPIKYSVLPQYLKPNELIGGNGLVQGSTFLAIIFGTILGNELILTEWGVTLVSVIVVLIAIIGFIAAWNALPAPPAAGEKKPVDWLFPRAIWQLIARISHNKLAFRTLFFISWFWFLGATFLSLLPAYAKEVLGADEGVLTVLLAAFSVGVAIGALLSERLIHGRSPICLPPYGALGMGIMAIELWFATPTAPPPELLTRAEFFSDLAGWRILIDFVLISACAGAYVTPLNAILQQTAEDEARAQYIAASNVIDASFIVLSAAVVGVLIALGLRADGVLTVLTASGLIMAFVVARFAPETAIGRATLRAFPRRIPNPDFPPGTP